MKIQQDKLTFKSEALISECYNMYSKGTHSEYTMSINNQDLWNNRDI